MDKGYEEEPIRRVETRDKSPLERVLDDQEKILGLLSIAVEDLNRKLEPILCPAELTPNREATMDDDRPASSSTVFALDSNNKTLVRLQNQLSIINNRADV